MIWWGGRCEQREGTLHAAVLVAPASEPWKVRKARQRAAARLQAERVRGDRDAAKAKAAAERQE